MNTPHTPGPWTTERGHMGQWIKAGESHIAPIPDHIEHEGKPCGSIASQDKTQAEIDANARLIAAAPELLAALEELLPHAFEYWNEYGGDDDYISRARAAIAKAKGGAL